MTEKAEVLKSKVLLAQALTLVNAPLVVDERLKLLAKIVAEHMGVDDVSILLKEAGTNSLLLKISLGLDQNAIGKDRIPIGQGVTGTVAQTREYIATRNILKDPRNLTSIYAQDDEFPSVLSFPILDGKDLIGVVNLRSRKERDFSSEEAEELSAFTAHIAGSIKNAQAYESLQYKAKLLELSSSVTGSLTSSLDVDILLEEVAWEIAHGFDFEGVLILLLDDEGNISKSAHYGLKSTFVKNFPMDIAQSCMLTGEPKVQQIDTAQLFGQQASPESWNICLPLISRDRTIGVMGLFDIKSHHHGLDGLFASIGIDVLIQIAGVAALAIENATIHSELRHLADENKKKLDIIGTMFSRMSAMFDAISNGIIAVDENGVIFDFNTIAQKSLALTDNDKAERNIDTITSYQQPLSQIVAKGEEIDNRVITFLSPKEKFAAVVNIRTFTDPSGEQQGSVISFRPMEETVKLLSRFTSQRPRYTFEDIIGNSTSLAETVRLAKIAAGSNSNILIVGESGTGKELFSQSIHNASAVAEGPFIPVNCAAIPKDLIESELFGYAEGAFTGARKGGYIGKFEQATGGTIFLDEIGDMPIDLQVKLLRVLQEKIIQRVGSEHSIPISTRVIAATNRDLKKAILDGDFREELYWRLNVISIEIPPLRERKIDIPEFVRHFIRRFSESAEKEVTDIEPSVMQKLINYSWRGNTRELENAIEHAVLMTRSSVICWADFPTGFKERYDEEQDSSHIGESVSRAQQERHDSSVRLYREAVIQAGGDVTKAAEKLGMSRATLYRRLKKYNLTEDLSHLRSNINSETDS